MTFAFSRTLLFTTAIKKADIGVDLAGYQAGGLAHSLDSATA